MKAVKQSFALMNELLVELEGNVLIFTAADLSICHFLPSGSMDNISHTSLPN